MPESPVTRGAAWGSPRQGLLCDHRWAVRMFLASSVIFHYFKNVFYKNEMEDISPFPQETRMIFMDVLLKI